MHLSFLSFNLIYCHCNETNCMDAHHKLATSSQTKQNCFISLLLGVVCFLHFLLLASQSERHNKLATVFSRDRCIHVVCTEQRPAWIYSQNELHFARSCDFCDANETKIWLARGAWRDSAVCVSHSHWIGPRWADSRLDMMHGMSSAKNETW